MKVTADERFAIVPEFVLDADVSDRAVRLYAVLRRYADAEGTAWPSRRTLAVRLRCSIDSIDRATAELVALEAVSIEKRHVEGTEEPDTNLYRVASVRPGSRRVAATGGRTVAARGSRTAAAPKNENQLNESQGNEKEPAGGAPRVITLGSGPPSKPAAALSRRRGKAGRGSPSPEPRPADPAFEALAECWLGRPYAELELTGAARGRINQALAEVADAFTVPTDTPLGTVNADLGREARESLAAEIRRRWAIAIRREPEWSWTPQTFAAYWPALAVGEASDGFEELRQRFGAGGNG